MGQKSLLGEESREEGLDEREREDMGLGSGEAPCCSTEERDDSYGFKGTFLFYFPFLILKQCEASPAGMMTDRAVAEADLITLVPGRELRLSLSDESCWCRTFRNTRSVVAPWGPWRSGRPRMLALPGVGSDASAGLKSLSVTKQKQ